MALTSKELMLIKDNVKFGQNSVTFLKGCVDLVTDPQVKNLCNQMVTEHERDVNGR